MNHPLRVERHDQVALVTFDRPETRNALNAEMVRALHHTLNTLGEDPDLRAVVMTGAGGKAFVSGADIAELKERRRGDALAMINTGLFRAIEEFPRPTIAAINGYALGGGCELAMACDLRIGGESAVLGQPEVKLGILPGAGATYRLPRLVGLGRAKDLILTGRLVYAAEALQMGLLNQVVPDHAVVATALEVAQTIAGNAPWAVRYAKLALNATKEMSTGAAMAFEATAQSVLFEDDDKMQRMEDFLRRRSARAAAPEDTKS